MKQSLKASLPFAEAFAKLFHPFAEAVVHDLESDTIAAIFNPLSRREVGDPSYLDRINFDTSSTVIGPYPKTNWDGRPMKSISVVLKNQAKEAEGFLCINVDVSTFNSAAETLKMLLESSFDTSGASEALFSDDLYDRINCYVQEYCRRRQTSVEALRREEKKELVKALEADGALAGKHAATYIGRVVGLSRATIYNYLKEED